MTARDTYNSSVATNHTSAQVGGVTTVPGTPSLPNNRATWSHAGIEADFGAGLLTQSQRVAAHQSLNSWESGQQTAAAAVRGPDGYQ